MMHLDVGALHICQPGPQLGQGPLVNANVLKFSSSSWPNQEMSSQSETGTHVDLQWVFK